MTYENISPRQRNLKSTQDLEEQFDKGYDSDGQLGPFWGTTTKEGPQLFDYDDDDDRNCFVKEVSIEEQLNAEANTETNSDTNAETNAEMNTEQNKETNNKPNSNDLDKGQAVPLDKEKFDKLTVNDLKKRTQV